MTTTQREIPVFFPADDLYNPGHLQPHGAISRVPASLTGCRNTVQTMGKKLIF